MAQQPAKRPSSTAPGVKNDKAWTPPRTAWGDPDLQGTYTNKDESGIPFERSNQFEGKALADVDDVELAELIRERQKQISERAPLAGGETGAGPVHWYENYEAKNSRAWLVVDPQDGRIPPQTAEATRRAAALAAARGARGPADAAEDRSLYDRCISRGLPVSMMPAIYGNPIRSCRLPRWPFIRKFAGPAILSRFAAPARISALYGSARAMKGDAGGRDNQLYGQTNYRAPAAAPDGRALHANHANSLGGR
jgi:hypothetical protein